MFIEINNKNYNLFNIQSFMKSDYEDETGISYDIDYRLSNGELITEEFDNENDRDSKYDEIVTKATS